jgi:Cu2+-exporting ATPase
VTAASGFQAIPGQGARATVGGRQVHVGGPALGRALSLDVPAALGAAAGRARDRGQAAIFLVEDGAIVAVFAVADVLRPESRAAVDALHQAGVDVIMMTGDAESVARSVASALGTADVGIAIGGGTDVAVEAGDVVLVRSDPRDVSRVIALSRASYRKMVQNLWWAAGYNIVAIPLAAGVLAPVGIVLSPAVGAALMSLSTVVEAINAQLLRRAVV